jgi:predicted permease
MKSSGIRWIDRWRMAWRSLVGKRGLDRELRAELDFHRESLLERYRAQGLTPAEASRRVRLELGGPDQITEEVRDQRAWLWLDRLRADTTLAFRTFRKFPGFTVTALTAIAIGMGANSTLFTVMHAVLSRPLPVGNPSEIRNVYLEVEQSGGRRVHGSPGYVSWRELLQLERSTTAEVGGVAEFDLTWRDRTARPVHAQLVTANFLSLIGGRPTLGRFFAADEASRRGTTPVVVVSHRFWRRELGRDSAIVGRPLTLNRQSFTVIGVADSLTDGPLLQRATLWIPLTMQPVVLPTDVLLDAPATGWLMVFARKRPGSTDAELQAEMAVLGPRAVASHDSVGRTSTYVVPGAFLNFPQLRQQALPAIGLLWVAFLLMLIVACANVANLLLARGVARQREIAVRLALGASRGRVIGQLLTESAWLGILGGALGLAVSSGVARLIPAALPANLDFQLAFTPDRSILGFTALAAILSGLAFGLLPAFHLTRLDLTPGLKTEGQALAGAPRARTQHALVGLQVATSIVLLINAGLVIRSFTKVLAAGVGKPLDHLLIVKFDLQQQQYDGARSADFFRQVGERVDAQAGVVSSGVSIIDPELGAAETAVSIGDSADASALRFPAAFDQVEAGSLSAIGLRVLAGRTFTHQEVTTEAPVIVVDERFAARLGNHAIGQRVWISVEPIELNRSVRRQHEIIGIVNSTTPLTFWSRPEPTYYVPIAGARYLEANLLVRYRGSGQGIAEGIRRAALVVDPEVTATVKPIEENVGNALLPARILSAGLSTLGGLALTLAAVGLFGMIGFAVGRRRRELGIRMAIGASPRQIVALVCRQGAKPVLLGLVVGLGLAIGGGLAARSIWEGLSPLDPVPITFAVVLLTAAAALAFLVPARRAARVRPASVLRVD